jgi:hypothetical protein
MKKIIMTFAWIFLSLSPVSAIKLSEVIAARPVGKNLSKWQASELVSDFVVGKIFAVPSEQRKIFQLRFFTFEDRNKALEKKNSFAEFVKKFGLEDLESKANPLHIPYNDGTFHTFTHKNANEFLKEKGKEPLPEGLYFMISFREVIK